MASTEVVLTEENLQGSLVGRRFADAKSLLDKPAGGRLMSAVNVKELIIQQLGEALVDQKNVRFGDNQYYLPTQDEMDFIITESGLERKKFMAERFDCDDFAFILKGEVSAHAYQAGQLTCGICAGIAWGYFQWNPRGYHAANWFLDSSGVLNFIEPQWDVIFPVEQCQKGVDLFLA